MRSKLAPRNRIRQPRTVAKNAGPAVLVLLLICDVAAFAASAVATLPATPAEADIVLHITDFGINQWSPHYRTGADFSAVPGKTPNRVHTDLCNGGTCDAQILLVMPERPMSHAALKAELKAQLQQKLDQAISNNTREFEIQLVQNINTKGNFDQKQQALVEDFGRAAYEAIGEVRKNIVERKGLSVYTDATAGSNGTVMLTKNIGSWSSYLQAIDLVDGRADMQPTIDTIDAVIRLTGKNNVRIFTAMGDHPAANRPTALLLRAPLKLIDFTTDVVSYLPWMGGVKDRLGWKPNMAIGNNHIVAEIMRQRPGTEAFYIERLDLSGVSKIKRIKFGKKLLPGPGHVASMNGRELAHAMFNASRIVPKKKWGFDITAPVKVSFMQMRNKQGLSTSMLQVLTAPSPPPSATVSVQTVTTVKTPTTPPTRGGVLMDTEPRPVQADLQSFRDRILKSARSGDPDENR